MKSFDDMLKNSEILNKLNKRNEAVYNEIINSSKFKQFEADTEETITKKMIEDEILIIKKFIDQNSECVTDNNGNCISHPDGYLINLEVRNGTINHYLTPCPVKLEQDRYKEKQKLIQSFFIAQDIVDAKFDDLEIVEG